MPRSLIALGANLGDREHTLRRAVELLTAEESIALVAASRFHETTPIGGPAGQGSFLNAAVALETTLSPEALHPLLRRVEHELGRRPAPRWSPRPIDLDLLLYDDQVIATPTLTVPHPRMAFRRFVLTPAAEVAPEMVHPLIDWTVAGLLEHLNTAAPYVAMLGMPDRGKSTLAQAVARAVGGSYLADPVAASSVGAGDDPSGHAPRRPIQFLDCAARALESHDWRHPRGVAVSDFYFDQCLAYARLGLEDVEYQRFRQAWAVARKSTVAPKLLVVLDTWEEGLRARADGPRLPADAQPTERLRRELLALAARPKMGPTLYAGRGDPQAQFDEITAAIAAMD